MAEHVWSLICSHFSVDATTHNVSLNEIIEDIQVKQVGPPLPPGTIIPARVNWKLATTWARSDRAVAEVEVEEKVEIYDPDGRRVAGPVINPFSLADTVRARTVGDLQVLPVTHAGTYKIQLAVRTLPHLEWMPAATVLLDVTFERSPP